MRAGRGTGCPDGLVGALLEPVVGAGDVTVRASCGEVSSERGDRADIMNANHIREQTVRDDETDPLRNASISSSSPSMA